MGVSRPYFDLSANQVRQLCRHMAQAVHIEPILANESHQTRSVNHRRVSPTEYSVGRLIRVTSSESPTDFYRLV